MIILMITLMIAMINNNDNDEDNHNVPEGVLQLLQRRREPLAHAEAAEAALSMYTFLYNPAKPSGRGGGPPPSGEGDLLVL